MYRVLRYKKVARGKSNYSYRVVAAFDTLAEARDFCGSKPLHVIEFSKKAIKDMAA